MRKKNQNTPEKQPQFWGCLLNNAHFFTAFFKICAFFRGPPSEVTEYHYFKVMSANDTAWKKDCLQAIRK